jgi:dihydroorotase
MVSGSPNSPGQTIVVRGGTVIDATGTRRADVVVVGDRITAVGEALEVPRGALVLDAGGCVVAPGLVDLHAHLRQPGMEEAETVETGSRAAALGGYTAVVAMPNTTPPIDDASMVRDVLALGRSALCRVAVAGAITVGRAGERLAPMAEMAQLGVCLFTDDGTGVQEAGVMRRALEYAGGLGVTLAQHCEDASLASGGQMHEGAWSSRLGVPGIPAAAEEVMVARDIALVRLTGARMHFLHLSTAGSIRLVADAKAEGLPVTAEVAPHHLVLTDGLLAGYDPVYKVNPPLRGVDDVAALRQACRDGVVDAVATDHAPHPPEAKEGTLDVAPPGMLGLETALGVTLGALVAAPMTLPEVLGLLSWRPAAIAGMAVHQGGDQGGPIVVGGPANLCVIDPEVSWRVDPAKLASRARNTPYVGMTLTGRTRHTICRGEPVVIDGQVQR